MITYFFDLTGTAWHLKRTTRFSGIQRTVVMMIEKAAGQIGAEHVHLGYFDKGLGGYRTFPLTALAPGELTDAEAFRARLGYGAARAGLHPVLNKYRDRPLKLWFHRLTFQLAALVGYERPFTRSNITSGQWRAHHRRSAGKAAGLPLAPLDSVARPGDHLVLLDGTFTVSRAAEAFRAARDLGLSTSTMIYDLIPIAAPELVSGLSPLTFHDWLLETESYTDRYLTDSDATRRDLQVFLAANGIERRIDVVCLAQAPLPSETGTAVGPLADKVNRQTYPKLLDAVGVEDRVRALARDPFVLCVGTLEVRKNIWRLATVWDRLRQIEGLRLPKLVFAGRSGWLKDDFDRLMQATGQLGGWVEIVDGPSDRELEYLYRSCEFLAMPSLYEGWGLPVGEALSYGKTAVVSNTSSLPEVGLDLVEYCDPTSIDSIAEACLRLIRDPARRSALEARIRAATLRSWDDVAADLVATIGGK